MLPLYYSFRQNAELDKDLSLYQGVGHRLEAAELRDTLDMIEDIMKQQIETIQMESLRLRISKLALGLFMGKYLRKIMNAKSEFYGKAGCRKNNGKVTEN